MGPKKLKCSNLFSFSRESENIMEMVLEEDIKEIFETMESSIKKMHGKTVLITGAAGFLGRYFMSLLTYSNRLNSGNPITIIALDNYITSGKPSGQNILRNDVNVEWIVGDASIGSQLPNKFDYIIHTAGIASPEHYRANPLLTIDVTINVTKSLLERAKSDNSRMLFFSSSEIYGDPFPEFVPTNEDYRGNVSTRGPRACYDESKRLGETLCWIYQTYFDVHVCVARPFNVYGPGMMPKDYRVLPNFATQIAKKESLKIYGSGNQTRTFCYISDAIIGFMKILLDSKNPDVFNVGNPTPEVSMIELTQIIKRVIKDDFKVELIEYPATYPADEPNRRCPDITRISESLGFQPKVNIEEGLARFFRWTNDNYTSEILAK
jgi:UDP-glucuronate decarboxylase